MPPTHRLLPATSGTETRPIAVAVETPINITYATLPYAVMMATPADLEDFALGFSLTEGVVSAQPDIRATTIEETAQGLILRIHLAPELLHRHLARRRVMAGRTSCGVCGIESLDQLPNAATPLPPSPAPSPEAIQRALAELDRHQPLHALTRAVHAAAWANASGQLLLAREDVGRHNALDKLIGACLRAGIPRAEGFILVTSRASYEMVEKAAAFGAPALVAISAPTTLAIDRATALGLHLIAIARPDFALTFTRISPL